MKTSKAHENTQIVLEILKTSEKLDYIGEKISQLEHSLQAAYFAQKSGASRDLILAALLHDIGHFCQETPGETMGEYGVAFHEKVGADFLQNLGFAKSMTDLIEGHVAAKRFLVSQKEVYLKRLSPASQKTLEYQGGPMDASEREIFKNRGDFEDCLKVRSWDEMAKNVDFKVPDLNFYQDLMIEHLIEKNGEAR